uniref:Protein kinase domain-containing protein n=1 Tax=Ciona savignyi TaxID=51511 RepID=H2Z535_CIOSA
MSSPMLCTPNFNIDSLKCKLDSSCILGIGGSAITFKGLHGIFGEVAAKVLAYNKDLDTTAANEIDLLSTVNANSFVVNFYGWCMMKRAGIKHPVIVMEYMAGGSLHQLLYRDLAIKLPIHFKNRLIKELAGAINFLHSKLKNKNPIVHCDLKPQNLLLTMEMHLKVSDLGSAARSSTTEHIQKDKDDNFLYITHRYCAPELFTGNLNKRPLPQVDIYSFGIILWEIMVREEPYRYANGGDFIQHAVKNHAN